MVHIGGFLMGLKKSHRISNFLLHQIAYFCGQYIKKKPLKYSYFSGFHDFSFCKSGATRNRNPSSSVCISLLFRIALTAISSYCSTAGLLHSAHRRSGWFLGANIVIYLGLPSFLSLNLLISLSKSLSSSSISRWR